MGLELTDRWSLATVIMEHFEDEVFEFRGKGLSSDLLPVLLELVVKNEVVEVLILLCFFEWEDALDDDEEDDAGRKYVYLPSIILFSFFNFWGHIGHGTSVRLELIYLFVSSKSKIGYF